MQASLHFESRCHTSGALYIPRI